MTHPERPPAAPRDDASQSPALVTGRRRADRGRSAGRDLGRLLLGHARRFRGRDLQDVATRALRDTDGRRAWIVSILNASLWTRRLVRDALWLRPRRLRTRLAFRRRHRGPVAGDRTLSLLCPTRDRVGQVVALLDSIRRTAARPGRIEVLFYVDSDDPRLAGYRDLFARAATRFAGLGRVALVVGEPIGVPAAWNELAAQATGDLLLMANDDQRYVDFGWDVRLDDRVRQLTGTHPDGVLCLYFDGGQYPEGGHDFPIVSRPWYATLGYFTPTMFSQWEVETWVFDIAERLGRLYAVPGVFVEHLHYQDYKAPFDATYQRHRMTREKSFADHALFLRTAPQRQAEVTRLRAVTARGGVPGAVLDAAAFWFTGYLAAHRDRVATEVAGWLAGRPAGPWHRMALFDGGGFTAAAERDLPVLTEVLRGVPDAQVPAGAIDVGALGPGSTAPAPLGGPPDARWVYWAVPERAAGYRAGERLGWAAGGLLVVDDRLGIAVRNEGDGPVAVVRFAVPATVPDAGQPSPEREVVADV